VQVRPEEDNECHKNYLRQHFQTMKKWIEAVINPPRGPEEAQLLSGTSAVLSGCAVLPQNTDNELVLSEVHTKLDAALTFLQRDLGYALLDDVRPRPGGGVKLQPHGASAGAAVPKGERSAKLPKEYGRFHPAPRESAVLREGSEELDDHVIKLLHEVFARSGGKLNVSELVELCRRQPVFRSKEDWGRLFWAIRNGTDQEITWEEFQAFYAERSVEPHHGLQSSSSATSSTSVPRGTESEAHAGSRQQKEIRWSDVWNADPSKLRTEEEAELFVLPFSSDWSEVLDAKLRQLKLAPRNLMVHDRDGIVVNLFGDAETSLPSNERFPLAFRAKEESPDHATKEMLYISQLSKDISKYAQYPCDLILIYRFQHMLYKTALEDAVRDVYVAASGGSAENLREGLQEAERRCSSALNHDGLFKTVLQSVRLMHLCDWDYADVVLVLAYASVYFRGTFSAIGRKMSPNEAAHVTALLIYLAHAFLLDETCPLRAWQKHIFRKYCTLKVLDAALFRLFKMRPGYSLRITEEEERAALLGLSGLRYSSKPAGNDAQAAADAIAESDISPCELPPLQGGLDGVSETSTASTVSRTTNGKSRRGSEQESILGCDRQEKNINGGRDDY